MTDAGVQKDANGQVAKRKIEILLQQWERHRSEEGGPDAGHLDNPQQDEGMRPLPKFKDTLVTEKQLSIDVQL